VDKFDLGHSSAPEFTVVSALGHKQTFALQKAMSALHSDRESGFPQKVMSALPQKADIGWIIMSAMGKGENS
jgi:hypothetical protein